MAGYIKIDATTLSKLKKGYIGNQNSIAKKIKKAYIGDSNGVAQKIWSGGGGKPKYYGTVSGLAASRYDLASAQTNQYVYFSGGNTSSSAGATGITDVYDENLTHSRLTSITSRSGLAGAALDNKSLFAGGKSSSSKYQDVVEGYNGTTLIKLDDLKEKRGYLAGGATTSFAYFVGGYFQNTKGAMECSARVDIYDINLTHSFNNSFNDRAWATSVSTPDYVFFAGGEYYQWEDLPKDEWEWTYERSVDVYDDNGSRISSASLSQSRDAMAGANVTEFILFAGGYYESGSPRYEKKVFSIVDVFNTNVTKLDSLNLSVAKDNLTAATLGNYALFVGGGGLNGVVYDNVDIFDENLTKIDLGLSLSEARENLGSGTIGNYALFAGGHSGSSSSTWENYKVVDVFELD